MIRAYNEYGNVVDLVAWEKKIREDAIDECLKIAKCNENMWDGAVWIVREIEELKEQKDE